MRTIVVMRHAKAEQAGATDFERRLAERGRAAAAEAGSWLAAQGMEPELALVSAAVRTEETWDALVAAAGWDLDPELDEGLYTAGTQSALDLLRGVDDGITSVLILGHNPTMASLAAILDDGEGDEEAGNELALGYPAGAVTVFEYDGKWSELDEASASLVKFHVSRA